MAFERVFRIDSPKLMAGRAGGGLRFTIDPIHDLWFDLEDLLGESGKTRHLRLTSDFRREPVQIEYRLTIGNVLKVEVRDTERIRYYDLNELEYHEGVVTVVTGVPLLLRFVVSSLELVLEKEEGIALP
jgi:hypothetical protein